MDNFENLDLKKIEKFSFNGMTFRCRVIKVYDGDTITCVINYNNNFYKIPIRLCGIDTSEKTSSNNILRVRALKSRSRLVNLLDFDTSPCCMVTIVCKEFDKYGRTLADVYSDKSGKETVQTILISEKLAYMYGGNKKMTEAEQVEFFT
jgi:endonuclease YncB( thermonuclease family)